MIFFAVSSQLFTPQFPAFCVSFVGLQEWRIWVLGRNLQWQAGASRFP